MKRLIQSLHHSARRHVHLALFLTGAFLLWSAAATAQNIQELTNDAHGFEGRIAQLEERYLVPALLEARFRMESRFNDAKVAYLLEDYARASILFVDILDSPKVRQFDSYRESLFLLGDSLFHLRNYRASREYLRQLVELGPGTHYQDAVIRMLEIASLLNDYDEIDALFARLDSPATVGPTVSYMRAKTLYEQGKHAEARRWFQRAREERDYSFSAHYFEGVSHVSEGNLAEAKAIFEAVIQRSPSRPKDSHVVDLARLALGRLAYEEGDFDTAIDYYTQLPRTSPSFERSLYELTWALVSKKSYEAALRNVEILLYFRPDPTFEPEAKLLRADLALRVGNYGEASLAYQDVIDTFTPVRKELDEFIASHDDLEAFFVNLVRMDLQGTEPDYLPPLVAEFAGGNKLLDSATQVLSDLHITQDDIDEASAAIEEIEARLDSGSRVEAFPHLAEGLAIGIETETQLIDLHHQLLDRERELLDAAMSAQERERWAGLEEQMNAFLKRYAAVPKTRDEFRRRDSQISSEFARLRRELEAVAYELESQRIQLNAIDTYLRQNPPTELSPDERRTLDEMRGAARDDIVALEKQHRALARELELTRSQVGAGDRVASKEAQLRDQYRDLLGAMSDFLNPIRARAGGEIRTQLAHLKAARDRLPAAEARLRGFFGNMNDLVDEKVADIRQTIDQERRILAKYQRRLDGLVDESEATAAGIAYLNFLKVGEEFTDIIMRGEVGLIDVGWRSKEDMTARINQLFEDRASELQLLRESFKDVR